MSLMGMVQNETPKALGSELTDPERLAPAWGFASALLPPVH